MTEGRRRRATLVVARTTVTASRMLLPLCAGVFGILLGWRNGSAGFLLVCVGSFLVLVALFVLGRASVLVRPGYVRPAIKARWLSVANVFDIQVADSGPGRGVAVVLRDGGQSRLLLFCAPSWMAGGAEAHSDALQAVLVRIRRSCDPQFDP